MVVKVDVQKSRGGVFWTNRYLLDLASPADVSYEMAGAIAGHESQFHATTVNFISTRVSDMVPDTDNFYIYPWDFTGALSDGGSPMPGFITMRTDMGVGPGRPLRKYYRTYVGEDRVAGPVWEGAYVTLVKTTLEDLLVEVPTICDPQGNQATYVVAKPPLQMRQLRRGTRKPLTPVIPVS